MAAKALVTVDKYLRTSFDGPDREFVDGDIVERNAGDKQHSRVQGRMVVLFSQCAKTTPLFCYPDPRARFSPDLQHRTIPLSAFHVPDCSSSLATRPVQPV
jgi:hypothetical protein